MGSSLVVAPVEVAAPLSLSLPAGRSSPPQAPSVAVRHGRPWPPVCKRRPSPSAWNGA
ncbi:hypothetical protein OV079_05180 [Nannocystis pusilla]|uniref:Uncharacterized protein n=1 Tax=Nannocystis pusilla TaxID=889268 RepID=A0A9X3EIX5_9BACT|nr:hypothetical protein [Nannocystis pusilla]MCY1004973.1 hypothetical protein [Nannocystis pusilla]